MHDHITLRGGGVSLNDPVLELLSPDPNYDPVEWMVYLVAAAFALVGAACVLVVAISLPGTWIMLGLALLIEFIDGLWLRDEPAVTFGWWPIGIATGLAAVGEVIEFLAGAAGAKGGGATRRGMIGAIVGGMVGAIVFTFALPLPPIGTLVGAVVGTFAGAIIGEMSGAEPRSLGGSLRPATGATIGRVLGTVAKVCIATVMWLLLSIAAFM